MTRRLPELCRACNHDLRQQSALVKLLLSVYTVRLPTSRFTDEFHPVLSRNIAQLPDQRLG